MTQPRQLCTFRLDGLSFGVPVEQVQEVLHSQPMTRVPLAPAVVRGLINLRGQIVTAFDLHRRLGLAERRADFVPMNVVVRTDDGPVSFLVDEIGDVVEVHPEQFETPPNTLRGPARQLVLGAYKLPNQLLLVLDPNVVVRVEGDSSAW